MSLQSDAPTAPTGHSVYTPLSLFFYDAWVHGFSDAFVWRCPLRELRALYRRNVSANHLDIGVGTGLLLDRTTFPTEHPSITLMDLNTTCLDTAAKRIARHAPRVVQGNVLAPLPPIGPFSSVGLCNLLHCVPGNIPAKAVAFDHIKAVMAPGARIFGVTVVQGVPTPWATQRLMDFYNERGIFSNRGDTIEDLAAELTARFPDAQVWRRGQVALFEATRP